MDNEIRQIEIAIAEIRKSYEKTKEAPIADEIVVEIPELVIEIVKYCSHY